MNPDGQVYFGNEDDIPDEDKQRLELAEVEEKIRQMNAPYDQDREDQDPLTQVEADLIRRMAEAETAAFIKGESEAAERNRMLDEGGHNDDE